MKPGLPAFLQRPLAREIALAIAIKFVLIVAIFYAFFDGRRVQIDADAVAARLTSPHPAGQAHPPSGSPHAD